MTHHVLREAAAWSEQLSRAIYVIRLGGDAEWQLTPQLACPCCLLATVCGRQVVGRRYVCFGCGWSGNAGPCPKCGGKLIDRWQEFADEARAAA